MMEILIKIFVFSLKNNRCESVFKLFKLEF